VQVVVRGSTGSTFCHYSSLSSFAPGDAPIGRPARKASKAIKTLLDQIKQTEIGASDQSQSDDLANFVESEPESDGNPLASSDDSDEEPQAIAPIHRPAAKKKIKAKVVVDTGDISDDDDGMDLLFRHLIVALYNLQFFRVQSPSALC
jgi:hypothetical protein